MFKPLDTLFKLRYDIGINKAKVGKMIEKRRQTINPYPRYELSNGEIVDFMCMSHDDMELYHTLSKEKLLYDRANATWWHGNNENYPKRTTPLFGVVIQEVVW